MKGCGNVPVAVAITFWTYLRLFFRFFVEGVLCYSLFDVGAEHPRVANDFRVGASRYVVLFGFLNSFVSMSIIYFFDTTSVDRLASVVVALFYFWHRERAVHGVTRRRYSNSLGWRCILTAAVFSALVVECSLTLCHVLMHSACVSLNVYDIIKSNWVLYEIYKSLLMFLHLCVVFLVYKLRFLALNEVRDMATRKWVVVSFSLCLLLLVYIRNNYGTFREIPSFAPFCDVLLWTLALLLPVYLGFYLAIRNLTQLLNVKANCAVDNSIFVWIFNPTVVQKARLNIYDSDSFMPSFESNKLAFKQRLEKLGIDNSCSGYSMLVFCLILTKLFMGLKGWSFERDVFGQASLVVDVPFPEVRKSIESVIERVWFLDDASVLIDGYYLPCCNQDVYDEGHRPTVEEFLTCMAKSV